MAILPTPAATVDDASSSSSSSSSSFRRTARWVIGGIGAELYNNIFVRPSRALFSSSSSKHNNYNQKEEVPSSSSSPSSSASPVVFNNNYNHNDEDVDNVDDGTYERELAIVSGATGGIGREICRGLLQRNYDVLILARNVHKGQQLADALNTNIHNQNTFANNVNVEDEDDGTTCTRGKQQQQENNNNNNNNTNNNNNSKSRRRRRATFVEYHADRSSVVRKQKSKNNGTNTTTTDTDTSLDNIRTTIGNRAVAVLVNNAGIMGKDLSKLETLRVNLVAPTVLTLALIPFLKKTTTTTTTTTIVAGGTGAEHPSQQQQQRRRPVVVNVGSSSHLRADKVHPEILHSDDDDDDDDDVVVIQNEAAARITRLDTRLDAYAQSKLGLMQFSNMVETTYGRWLSVSNAHPGLVWTSLLRSNFPGARYWEKVGIAQVLYKTPTEGAATILAAVDSGRHWVRNSRLQGEDEDEDEDCHTTNLPPPPYFVNSQPNGYASPESRNAGLTEHLWKDLLGPLVQDLVPDEVYNDVNSKYCLE